MSHHNVLSNPFEGVLLAKQCCLPEDLHAFFERGPLGDASVDTLHSMAIKGHGVASTRHCVYDGQHVTVINVGAIVLVHLLDFMEEDMYCRFDAQCFVDFLDVIGVGSVPVHRLDSPQIRQR